MSGFVDLAGNRVPHHVVTAAVLATVAMLTLLCGLVRRRRAFLRHVPGTLYVAAAAAAIALLGARDLTEPRRYAVVAAALLLAADWLVRWREADAVAAPPEASTRVGHAYLVAAWLAAALLLLPRLSTFAGSLLTWEAPVVSGFPEVGGFARAFEAGDSVWRYAVDRLVWDNGVLSAGHTSLFYGAPTYALFHVAGFSVWTLRILAVVATWLSVGVVYAMGRRYFGPVVGAAAAALYALNGCVLFYGRYGSSPAGTLLAVLLAVWSVWAFLGRDRPRWWSGPVCAAALFAATLQYSPARVVVLILLAVIAAAVTLEWRRLTWQRAVGLLVVVLAAAAVWQFEDSRQATASFLHARGEQYFFFVQYPSYVKELFGRDLLGRPLGPGPLTLADKLELLYRVVEFNLPYYARLLSPVVEQHPLGDGDGGVLPQLYYAPLAVFVVWGAAASLRRVRAWPHATLWLWFGIASVPLLLTNRVDAHRMVLFVVPLTLWAACGVGEAGRAMTAARMPRLLQHAVAVVGLATVFNADLTLLHRRVVALPVAGGAIVSDAMRTTGPLVVGALTDHRDLGWVHLAMLERTRRDPAQRASLIHEYLLQRATDSAPSVDPGTVAELERTLRRGTVLLAPAGQFQKLAATFQQRGFRVADGGTPPLRTLRIDGGAAATGVANATLRLLPTIVLPPTPTPMPLDDGPQVPLTDLKPRGVEFGFEPPEFDRAWGGGDIVMRGVRYPRGIGTHAWTRLTYSVPNGATAFQSVAGLSDDACDEAAVAFEVYDEQGRQLYASGVIDPTTGPRFLQVPLVGVASVTLVVTEGDNGRDCDHANWAGAAFLMGSPPPTAGPAAAPAGP